MKPIPRAGILVGASLAALMTMSADICAATLTGFAKLPANTLVPGPDSGHFIEAPQGVTAPFEGQIAQGFSAVIRDGKGGFIVLTDNGFGNRDNSPDFLLRLYFLNANFRTADGGLGDIEIEGFVNLSDPNHHMPYSIVADKNCYRSGEDCVEVERQIRSRRLLTGADLDTESLQPGSDGNFWIGDEFGPYLLEFSGEGVLLEPPFEVSGLVSESRPGSDPASATVRRSKGFEGMAKGPFGNILMPVLEGPLLSDQGAANLYVFDVASGKFSNSDNGAPSYQYRLDADGGSIGAFKLYSESTGLVLERDSKSGAEARFKKIFRIDLRETDEQGLLLKEEIVDLLKIDDPDDLNRDGSKTFSLPMSTIEGFVIRGRNQLAVITDNNYPFSDARGQAPEDTEFILIEVKDLW